jgi:two-component sensor histidine kinase
MSVVLHELATNAVKYGALSAPDGFVTVAWKLNDDGTLTLDWRERGGPPIAGAPQRQGFGSRLLDTTVRGQLGGRLDCDWAPEGLRCTLTARDVARPSAPAASAAD